MTASGNPWADPATEQDAYGGPPGHPAQPYPPGAPPPGYGWAPAPPPYWAVPGAPVPARTRRPGQVVAAAVLAFVQAAVVAASSAYLLLLVSAFGLLAGVSAGDAGAAPLVTEAVVLTVVQLLSAVALVVGGTMVLNRRSRPSWLTLVVACGVQLALALYWVVRLSTLDGSGDDVLGPAAALAVGVLLFTAAPAVALGLLLTGTVRRWLEGPGPR